LPCAAARAFDWHEREGAFERLLPPWRRVGVAEHSRGLRNGERFTLDLGLPAGRWRLEHHDVVAGREFHDRQVSGPFAAFAHAHRFRDTPEGGVLEDEVEWRLPGGPLAALADHFVRTEFARWFAWRHAVTHADLERDGSRTGRPLAVGVTGASGFLGRQLCAYLTSQGHRVVRFVRTGRAGEDEVAWDPARGQLDAAALVGLDAIVNLAGAGIAAAPWNAARKQELVESRVASTALLARHLAEGAGPRVWVSASAVGWYGDRGEDWLDETSSPGRGFLAELGRRWEDAAAPAARTGVRVTHPRIGLVLWPGQGALGKLVLPYRFGAGGPLGNGGAWWSWVGLHDLLDMLLFAIEDTAVSGAFNAVAPHPARQADFARALGRALGRPSVLPAPAFALRALLGREKADEMLLSSQRVRPALLERAGFRWRDPALEPLLARLYGVPRAGVAA
jgi:uncharacterized protein (TIGR01777 family)